MSEGVEGSAADDAQSVRALAFVKTILEKMEMEADVRLAPLPEGAPSEEGEGAEIRLEIEGPDAGRIIGKRGAVLEAIQYLTTRIVHKPGEPRKHVAVDAEGYRARHEEQLGQMAKTLGERVANEGKIITFDPMTARDRRIVHKALEDVAGVRTESSGEGPDRRVHIIPANQPTPVALPAPPPPQRRERRSRS